MKKLWAGRETAGERAFVVIWFCLALLVLLGFAGFSVDLGNWYINVERSQRAADAAALAGAVYLPDDPATAVQVSNEALTENNVAGSAVVYNNPDAANDKYMTVTLKGSVKNMFAKMIGVSTFSYQRTGIATLRDPLQMASPFNVLGSEEGASPSWLNGTSPVAVDYNMSVVSLGRYKDNTDRWDTETCLGSEYRCTGTVNDDYEPGGRTFVVNVDPGVTGWLAIQGYDVAMRDGICDDACHPNDVVDAGPAPDVLTSVNYPELSGGGTIATPTCSSLTIPHDDPSQTLKWGDLCRVYVDGSTVKDGAFKLHIAMPGTTSVSAINSFSLRAAIVSDATSTTAIPDKTKGVHVYSSGEMVSHHAPDATLNYYLAKIPGDYAGNRLSIQLYDFGETGLTRMTFKFFGTSVEPTGCTLVTSTGISMAASDGKCAFDVGAFSVQFNGQLTTVTVPIASDYTCPPAGDVSCWLGLAADSGSFSDEGSSISIGSPGTPVHLVKQVPVG